MKYNNLFKLLISIIICELAGVVGSVFTMPEIGSWYKSLNKPSFNPPNWIFGPAWTIIFVLMGISLYLVWQAKGKKKKAIVIFAVQLLLNIFWSALFFGFHSPFFALIEIIFLWLAILWTIVKFYKISKTASYLLFPYILWVSFAAFLNLFIWVLN